MKKKQCYHDRVRRGSHQILKEIEKSKVDGIDLRLGQNQRFMIHLSVWRDTYPSSIHKSWKSQSKRKHQWK